MRCFSRIPFHTWWFYCTKSWICSFCVTTPSITQHLSQHILYNEIDLALAQWETHFAFICKTSSIKQCVVPESLRKSISIFLPLKLIWFGKVITSIPDLPCNVLHTDRGYALSSHSMGMHILNPLRSKGAIPPPWHPLMNCMPFRNCLWTPWLETGRQVGLLNSVFKCDLIASLSWGGRDVK